MTAIYRELIQETMSHANACWNRVCLFLHKVMNRHYWPHRFCINFMRANFNNQKESISVKLREKNRKKKKKTLTISFIFFISSASLDLTLTAINVIFSSPSLKIQGRPKPMYTSGLHIDSVISFWLKFCSDSPNSFSENIKVRCPLSKWGLSWYLRKLE